MELILIYLNAVSKEYWAEFNGWGPRNYSARRIETFMAEFIEPLKKGRIVPFKKPYLVRYNHKGFNPDDVLFIIKDTANALFSGEVINLDSEGFLSIYLGKYKSLDSFFNINDKPWTELYSLIKDNFYEYDLKIDKKGDVILNIDFKREIWWAP